MNKESPLDKLFHTFLMAFLDHRIGFKTFKIASYLWGINALDQMIKLETLHLK